MNNLSLDLLRSRFIGSPLFQYLPETPDGSFEELLLHALDYAEEQKAEAERVDELYTTTLQKAQELKGLVNRLVNFIKDKPNEVACIKLAAKIETELMDYKEI